jgi:hypothetical protein
LRRHWHKLQIGINAETLDVAEVTPDDVSDHIVWASVPGSILDLSCCSACTKCAREI